MKEIGIALLGAATQDVVFWIRFLAQTEGIRLGPLWDHDTERGQRIAQSAGVRFEPDLAKTLTDPSVTAVAIGAETARRPELIAQAAAAQKPVLTDVPLAVSVEHHDRHLGGLPKDGVILVPSLPMRLDPMTQRLRSMIFGGKLGKVDMLRIRLGSNHATTGGFAKSWRANADLSGGGVFMHHGVHAVDYLYWLLGPPSDVVAQAVSSQLPPATEDNIIAVFRYPKNLVAEVVCSWVVHAATTTLEAYGEAGTIIAQGNDAASTNFFHEEFPRIYCCDFQEQRWQPVETPSTYRSDLFPTRPLGLFLDAIGGRAAVPVSIQDLRNTLTMLCAAYEASRTGRRMVFTAGERGLGFRPE